MASLYAGDLDNAAEVLYQKIENVVGDENITALEVEFSEGLDNLEVFVFISYVESYPGITKDALFDILEDEMGFKVESWEIETDAFDEDDNTNVLEVFFDLRPDHLSQDDF